MARKTSTLLMALLIAASAEGAAVLRVFVYNPNSQPQLSDPGATTDIAIAVQNFGDKAAIAPNVAISLPPGFGFVSVYSYSPWTCAELAGVVRCSKGDLLPNEGVYIEVRTSAPADPAGGRFTANVIVTSAEKDVGTAATIILDLNRVFTVTTEADGGAGSLRDAIERGNRECQSRPCKVVFRFEEPPTIRPTAPLPPITVCSGFMIDGGNPDVTGPRRVELRGEGVPFGSGLEIRTACGEPYGDRRPVWIDGLAIGGFPENGIALTSDDAIKIPHLISGSFIGTDRSGTVAAPNGLRGIAAASSGAVQIRQNVISGNRRSGIALWETDSVDIHLNRIGLGIDDRPLPNGASGVFLYHYSGRDRVRVSQNKIAYNADFGIGFAPRSGLLSISQCSIHDNGAFAVYGFGAAIIATPVITEASYDALSGETTVRGFWSGVFPSLGFVQMSVFANRSLNRSGHAEAETYLDFTLLAANGTFVAKLKGDYRGQWIAVQAGYASDYEFGVIAMSELSEGVRVQ
jgi:hypothetical protein